MIDEKITFKQINIAVITLSDTRKESDDKSGNTLKELIQKKDILFLIIRLLKMNLNSLFLLFRN